MIDELGPIYGVLEDGGKFQVPQNLALISFQLEYPKARKTEPSLRAELCSHSGGSYDSGEFNISQDFVVVDKEKTPLIIRYRKRKPSLIIRYLATATDGTNDECGNDCCVGPRVMAELGLLETNESGLITSLKKDGLENHPDVVAQLFANPLETIEVYVRKRNRMGGVVSYGLKYVLEGKNLVDIRYVREGDLFASQNGTIVDGSIEGVMGHEDWLRVAPTYRKLANGNSIDRSWRRDYKKFLIEEIIGEVVPAVTKEIK